MIKTKNSIFSVQDVPSDWIFQYYLGLDRPLNGADDMIRSPFSLDRTPSFGIYRKEGSQDYRFNCFSSGIKGSAVELVMALNQHKGIHITYKQAEHIIKQDFEAYLVTGEYVPQSNKIALNGKGRVTEHELRTWNEDDILYWNRYEITTKALEHFNIAPLKYFVIEKLVEGKMERYEFEHVRIYGFYRKDGSLYKIYRPGAKKGKYIKVGVSYAQGSDQITTPKENMLYIKSLKDIVAFHILDIDGWDLRAPDAEGIMLPKSIIEQDKKTYKKILSWMDPDQAGLRAAEKYRGEGISPIEFDMGVKDLSDSIERWSSNLVRIKVIQAL